MAKKQRPFLKWAGGKYRLLDYILAKLPEGDTLVEPFVGAGAVFLNTQYDNYILSDTNADLINLYKLIKKDGKNIIEEIKYLFQAKNNCKKHYYHFRDEFNHTDDKYRRATLFLYLNRHGYNGLCRYNQSGKYNVPFGYYKRPYFPEEELYRFLQKAKKAKFICADFRKTILKTQPGHVIYCDPPYVPLSESANFTQYHLRSFNLQDQEDLANLAHQQSQQGIPSLISNHYTDFTKKTYRHAEHTIINAPRVISCNANNRKSVKEILALYQQELLSS